MASIIAKDFIVCVDSDGCAMDTMNIKHQRFFGPLAAEVFDIRDTLAFQKEWERVNLFSATRGINRFKALVKVLNWAKDKGEDRVGDISNLNDWAENSDTMSNGALEKIIAKQTSPDLEKALEWSLKVNAIIEKELTGEDRPFSGVKEGLLAISKVANLAIVSSANYEALDSEWTRHGLMEFVDYVYGQEKGSKATAIADIINKGYERKNILMVGDAPGDKKAAETNRVSFFPILFNQESESWKRLVHEALPKLLEGTYTGEYNTMMSQLFEDHLADSMD